MSLGLIVKTGRILTARLLMGDPIEGINHCAIGEGDATFTDPLNPPALEIDQTALKNERARKKFYKRTFLKEDVEGAFVELCIFLSVNSVPPYRQATSGRLAHHRRSVEMCPLRTDFSREASLLIASMGR